MPEKPQSDQNRFRLRDYGIAPGLLSAGALNAITDIHDVCVGHFTLIEGEDIRTGATSVLPHGGNLFQDKVPAGVVAGNGYVKLTGSTQLQELGEIETPHIELPNDDVSPLFQAAIEATEEAISNSLFTATTVQEYRGTAEALPVERVIEYLGRRD